MKFINLDDSPLQRHHPAGTMEGRRTGRTTELTLSLIQGNVPLSSSFHGSMDDPLRLREISYFRVFQVSSLEEHRVLFRILFYRFLKLDFNNFIILTGSPGKIPPACNPLHRPLFPSFKLSIFSRRDRGGVGRSSGRGWFFLFLSILIFPSASFVRSFP